MFLVTNRNNQNISKIISTFLLNKNEKQLLTFPSDSCISFFPIQMMQLKFLKNCILINCFKLKDIVVSGSLKSVKIIVCSTS